MGGAECGIIVIGCMVTIVFFLYITKKAAYEISVCLVGSKMGIRDSSNNWTSNSGSKATFEPRGCQ